MREFPIGPEMPVKKIKGDYSTLSPESLDRIRGGRLSLGESSEKERSFENWLREMAKEPVLSAQQKRAVFYVNGALGEFCDENKIKISPPPITYYIPESQWDRVVEFYGGEAVSRTDGGVADQNNRIFINIREMRVNDPHYNGERFLNFIDNNNHENLHQLAYRAIRSVGKRGDDRVCFDRWGVTLHDRSGRGRYFMDFDEAIIYYFANRLTEKIINGHKDLFEEGFLGTDGYHAVRDSSAEVVRQLIERLAESRGGGPEATREVEKVFIDAEFKGDLPGLADEISKIYGRGGLWVLAHLCDGGEDDNRELALNFIKAKGKETQRHYAFRILAKKKGEYERYKRLMKADAKKNEEPMVVRKPQTYQGKPAA